MAPGNIKAHLAGTGNNRWWEGVGEEVRSGTLPQQVHQLFWTCGVAACCPAQRLAQSAVDDIHLPRWKAKVFICASVESSYNKYITLKHYLRVLCSIYYLSSKRLIHISHFTSQMKATHKKNNERWREILY